MFVVSNVETAQRSILPAQEGVDGVHTGARIQGQEDPNEKVSGGKVGHPKIDHLFGLVQFARTIVFPNDPSIDIEAEVIPWSGLRPEVDEPDLSEILIAPVVLIAHPGADDGAADETLPLDIIVQPEGLSVVTLALPAQVEVPMGEPNSIEVFLLQFYGYIAPIPAPFGVIRPFNCVNSGIISDSTDT
ncbi:hypothetical protein DRQ12_12120, partial [candidate division KSB1 bacterium]